MTDQQNASDENAPEVAAFIERWHRSEGGEHRTYQMFLTQLCQLLDVEMPGVGGTDYGFEHGVEISNFGVTSRGRIDLYKRGCFVLEAKQGSFKPAPDMPTIPGLPVRKTGTHGKGHGVRGTKQWDDAMMLARAQAKRYIDALPLSEGIPPFLIVVDIGYSFELFADFTRTGRYYTQFPDARSFRFKLEDLAQAKIRDRLRKVWQSPFELDPSLITAKVTRDIADKLARLAQSLETSHAPKKVADFLMRCLFTMFAEDVGLLKERSFTDLLQTHLSDPPVLQRMLTALWAEMNMGTPFSPIVKDAIRQFNGAMWNRPFSARCWNARWMTASVTVWARITRRAPMWNGLFYPPSSSHCAPNGKTSRPPP